MPPLQRPLGCCHRCPLQLRHKHQIPLCQYLAGILIAASNNAIAMPHITIMLPFRHCCATSTGADAAAAAAGGAAAAAAAAITGSSLGALSPHETHELLLVILHRIATTATKARGR